MGPDARSAAPAPLPVPGPAPSTSPAAARPPTQFRNSRRPVDLDRLLKPAGSRAARKSHAGSGSGIVRSRLDSMHFRMTALDWDDLRYLLALSRHGTLTAAAAVLGVTQPTVGRRLASLERQLRARLFRSTPQGAELSAVGEALARRALRMEAEALEATR